MKTDRSYWQVELNSKDWTNPFLPFLNGQDLISGHLKQCSYMINNPNGFWWVAMLKMNDQKWFFFPKPGNLIIKHRIRIFSSIGDKTRSVSVHLQTSKDWCWYRKVPIKNNACRELDLLDKIICHCLVLKGVSAASILAMVALAWWGEFHK